MSKRKGPPRIRPAGRKADSPHARRDNHRPCEPGYSCSGLTTLFHNYRNGAIHRGYAFDLSREEFAEMTKLNCFYCGVEPSQAVRVKAGKQHYLYNGVDRIDNTQGYTMTNCVTCCGTCNSMKNTHPFEEFTAHVRRIAKHMGL
jgi:hypothetical protein